MISVFFEQSANQTFADILEFFKRILGIFEDMFANFPPFLIPLIMAYLTISVVYFIVGRS